MDLDDVSRVGVAPFRTWNATACPLDGGVPPHQLNEVPGSPPPNSTFVFVAAARVGRTC